MMKIYLDNCCYNRPFDDQTQERIHLESGEIGVYQIIGSDILRLEIERMSDGVKKQRVKELYQVASMSISYSEEIKDRAAEIVSTSKIRNFDSLHIASAEVAGVDVLITTDDKLEKMAAKLNLKIKVMNPLKFAWEVL